VLLEEAFTSTRIASLTDDPSMPYHDVQGEANADEIEAERQNVLVRLERESGAANKIDWAVSGQVVLRSIKVCSNSCRSI
jgi:hypothetical protein